MRRHERNAVLIDPGNKARKIRIGFTPDRRSDGAINRRRSLRRVGYTIDGSEVGELSMRIPPGRGQVKIQGRNVHPGYAKNKMVNALANELADAARG